MKNLTFMFSYSWGYIYFIIIDQWADGFHNYDNKLYFLLLKFIIYRDFSAIKASNMHETKRI